MSGEHSSDTATPKPRATFWVDQAPCRHLTKEGGADFAVMVGHAFEGHRLKITVEVVDP